MKHQNKDIPPERQMLHILQYWDVVHISLAEARKRCSELEATIEEKSKKISKLTHANDVLRKKLAHIKQKKENATERPIVAHSSFFSKIKALWK